MPDDSLTSGPGEPADDATSEAPGELHRIAILARDVAEGDALWAAIDRRFRQKDKIAVLRVAREQADLVAHVLSLRDFADAKSVLAACAEIAKDPAPLKFVLAPTGVTVPGDVAARTGAVVLPGAASVDDNARTITRTLRNGATPEQRVEARLRANAAAKPEAPENKKEPPAPEAIAERKARNRASKAAIKAAKRASAEALAAKAERKQAKRGAKADPAEAPSAGTAPKRKKAPAAAAKTKRSRVETKPKAQPKPAKRPAKAETPKLSPEEAAAAKAARKAAKHQAKEQAKAERAAKKQPKPKLSPEEIEAAKAARKAAKEKAKAEQDAKKQPKPTLSPEEIEAAKAARKAAKHQAKEQAKVERETKKQQKLSPEEIEAAKVARKAAKEQAKAEQDAKKQQKPTLLPEEAEAAKAARKAAKHQAKEQAKAERDAKKQQKPTLSPEEIEAAKAARKAAKEQAKTEQQKKPKPSPEEVEAAKAARKAAKEQAKAEQAEPKLSPEEIEAAKAARKAAKHQAKEQAKAEREAKKQKPKPSPEEVEAAKAARKAAKAQAKAEKPVLSPEEIEAAKAARKAAKHQAKEQKKAGKQEKPKLSPEEAEAAKAARKAAKAQAKAEKPALSPEEIEAAKAARKAAKHQAKEQKKAGKQEKPKLSPEEVEAAKAARKAAKAQAKAEKPALSPEEIEAAKAARKAAKHQAKEQKKAGKQEKPKLSPEDAEAAKAARKAAKAQAKANEPALSPEAAEAAKAARKAAKHEAKEQAKAGRVSAKKAEASPEELAAKAEKKAEKKAAKRDGKGDKKADRRASKGKKKRADGDPEAADGADETRPLKFALVGVARAAELGPALSELFAAAGGAIETVADDAESDVVIRGFDDPALGPDEIAAQAVRIAASEARVQIFLERTAPGDDLASVNRAIAGLAAACGGTVLRLPSKFRRFASEDIGLVAEPVLGIVAEEFSRLSFTALPLRAAPDLVEARALAPEAMLSQLRWNSPAPPKSIWFGMDPEGAEAFADSKMALGGDEPVAFVLPIDWSTAWPERRTVQFFKGLEFLSGPLAYWYAKANGSRSDNVVTVDTALKERGTTPNAQLARAAQILVDFIARQSPAAAPDAWAHNVLERRARVALMYVLCCRSALKRKIKVNDAACGAVFAHLLEIVERLRADDFYEPCSVDGVQQDCLLVGLGLGLRGTAYGNALVKEGLERLKTMQLDIGLTADGVWHTDTYAMHCSVLTSLSQLLGDFPPADAALIEPFAAIAKKMTVFAEAMLKSNGAPPGFDDSKQKSYGNKLAVHRRSIVRAASGGKQNPPRAPLSNRVIDTYVFRDAQYFISHSSQKMEPNSSLAVLHADAPSAASGDPGGVVIAFAHGEKDLLVRAKLAEKIRARHDQAPLYDPRLRNGYRIGGEGNEAPAEGSAKTARIVRSWRGPGWAAARSVEDTYANASVARTVVHLKAAHALVVVDELATTDGAPAEFEQFWNIAPEFAAGEGLRFSSAENGVLAMAFADAAAAEIDTAESGTALHRRLLLARGSVAAVFQWTDAPAPLAIRLEESAQGWRVAVTGKGFQAALALAGSEFGCDLG